MTDASASTMAGMVLDQRYRILRPIKAGGMGTVYEGELLRLGKRVAIKVLRPEATYNEAARMRFEREAKLASRIRHRNVVELLDFGVEDDTAYYVMELLEGRDLASLLHEEGRIPWSRARSILLQVARGLAAAHRLGIVHRDVKPGNCYLVAHDDDVDDHEGHDPHVKVLDFGIAKLDPDHATDGGLTRTSELVGTVAYMSPEQARSMAVDARSDVYSLGVLAYQALTGERPFHDDNVFNLLLKHVQEPPRPLRSLEPSIPEAVEEAVLQALAKEPAARFPSMDAFRAALSAVPPTAEGSGTAIFMPDVDGAATIPMPRGASIDSLRAIAEAARAERAAAPGSEPVVSPTPTPTPMPAPVPLDDPTSAETRIMEPLSEPRPGNTAEQPRLEPRTGDTQEQRALMAPGATTVMPSPEGHTAIAPAAAIPISRPVSVTSVGSVGSRDRRLLAFVIAGALSLLVGVGLGVWLVQNDEDPTPTAEAAAPPTKVVATAEPLPSIDETPALAAPDLGVQPVVEPTELGSDEPAASTGSQPTEAADSGVQADPAVDEDTIDSTDGEVEEPEPDPTPRSTKKPRPKPTDARVKATLVRRAKKRCAGLGAKGATVRLSLSIDPEGAITLVRVEAPHHRGDLGQCVRSVATKGRFPGTGERRVLALNVGM